MGKKKAGIEKKKNKKKISKIGLKYDKNEKKTK